MRSARWAIATAALILVLTPLVSVAIAWVYERVLTLRSESALAQIASEAEKAGDALQPLAEREHVELFRLDPHGDVVAQSFTRGLAARWSSMGSAMQGLSSFLGERAWGDPWAQLDHDAGPVRSRRETRSAIDQREGSFVAREASSGEAVLYAYALPTSDGGAIYVQTATVRGLRKLVALRGELARLALYQLAAALVFAVFLGRWLVKPLERLSDGAAAFNVRGAVADPELLKRRDEVGTLARALDGLTTSLEDRRRETVALAADMAHELKNPLATIAAAAELIGTTRDPSPVKRAMVEKQITAAVDRLRAATDELLSLVRLEAELPALPRERVDLRAVLEDVVGEYRADPRYEHVRFDLSVAAAAQDVAIVPTAWERMVRNLLDNAVIQPMREPRVELAASRVEGGLVELVVRDHGPGVSEGNREKIFRRFFTQRPESAPLGTGLGLSIVRAVAQAHGGDVELLPANSSRPGAAFRVTFRA